MTNKIDLQNLEEVKPFLRGFTGGLSLVFIAGFGDKTFFLNMIYVSTNDFWEAFIVALLIAEFVNIFSIFLGKIIPYLISRDSMDWLAIIIFLFFGVAMIIEAAYMDDSKVGEALAREAEEEEKEKNSLLGAKEEIAGQKENIEDVKEEDGLKNASENSLLCSEKNAVIKLGVFDSWWKYCIAYLVGELGDKSQIATIVATTKYNFIGVFCGTALAQFLLVVTSILLGKSVSTLFTRRQITFIGGITFLVFTLLFLLEKFFGFM